MRVQLDDGKSYDLLAMFTPRWVGYKNAYEALRGNYSAWKNALTLPLRNKSTLAGILKWIPVLILHSLSLLLLLPLFLFGVSMKAYTLFLSGDQEKMAQYKADLKKIYRELEHIKDPAEYKSRLKEEIAKVKPF
jgi:hypothetical protein